MPYRKFKADYLFNGEELLNGGNVLITDDEGRIVDIVFEKEAGEDLQNFSGIISPGFINAHCHLELSHLKNKIPAETGLIDFVFKIVSERHFAEDEILDAIEKAEAEMFQNGIVAVGDICNNSLTAVQKIKGNLAYYNFIETSGWLPGIADVRFAKSKIILDEFEKDNLKASIVPHAPYSVSENLWKKISPFFPGKIVTIHSQENPDEDLFFEEGKGEFIRMFEKMKIDNSFFQTKKTGSVENYFQHFFSAASVILVHNTFTKQQDLNFIDQHKNKDQLVSFCLCPNANLYIEKQLPPVDLFLKNELNIILGTDSLASNHQLNILEEIKAIQNKFPGINTPVFLKWATLNGAKALQMEHQFGTFEKGKIPGVILIENVEGEKITAGSKIKRLI